MIRPQDANEDQKRWERMPKSDRRFINTLINLSEALKPPAVSYAVPSPRLQRTLRHADRATLFGVIVECLGLMFGAPALQRIKTTTRARRDRDPTTQAKRGRRSKTSRRRRRRG